MKNLLKNKFLLFTIIAGVILFAVVAYALLSMTATKKAAVLVDDVSAGTTITEEMVTEIDVPQDTPGNFISSKNSLVSQKAVNNLEANQLIYNSDLMTSIDSVLSENDEFIVTSILLPDERAIGGLLTAGDVVDISVRPEDSSVSSLKTALPDFKINTALDGGIYFVLSNVKLLDTTTAVSTEKGSNLSAVNSDEDQGQSGAYYLVSLSYNDYKKLRLAEQFGELWLNLAPNQNESYAPMLDEMAKEVHGGLSDAAVEPIKQKKAKTTTSSDDESSDSSDSDDSSNSSNSSSQSSNSQGSSSSSSSNDDEEETDDGGQQE